MESASKKLIEKAKEARERAYAPYSKYKVGAALLGSSGKIYTGCNVENNSYGATVCAERVAVFKAISEGEEKFLALVVFSDDDKMPYPCGLCRQVLWELAGDIKVVVINGSKESQFQLKELCPVPFVSNRKK
jgi:cytidine deaminase